MRIKNHRAVKVMMNKIKRENKLLAIKKISGQAEILSKFSTNSNKKKLQFKIQKLFNKILKAKRSNKMNLTISSNQMKN
jgi:hypothetical protein